jgi:hypothetical protein
MHRLGFVFHTALVANTLVRVVNFQRNCRDPEVGAGRGVIQRNISATSTRFETKQSLRSQFKDFEIMQICRIDMKATGYAHKPFQRQSTFTGCHELLLVRPEYRSTTRRAARVSACAYKDSCCGCWRYVHIAAYALGSIAVVGGVHLSQLGCVPR